MDRLRIVLEHFVLADRLQVGDAGALLVTGSARVGDVHDVRLRAFVVRRKYVVLSVTRGAGRGQVAPFVEGGAMDALLECGDGLVVAHVTLDGIEVVVVRQVIYIDVGVTRYATLFSMHRHGKLPIVDVGGKAVAIPLAIERAVVMAIHALGILVGSRRLSGAN